MSQVLCTECGNEFILGRFSFCTHCARPSLFPNVVAAASAEEHDALSSRYDAAVAQATIDGTSKERDSFEAAMSHSEAVVARYFADIERLSFSDTELYATYFQMVEANARVPASDKWNRIRAYAEEALFPGYKDRITFAALSLNRRGIPHYGDCFLIFRENMVSYRASVLDENCVLWIIHQKVDLMADSLPHGFKSTWGERHRIAVAKLAPKFVGGMNLDQFAGLLMQPRSNTNSEDEFVEVHIWGPWTRQSLIHVVIARGKNVTDPEVQALAQRLNSVGATLEVL